MFSYLRRCLHEHFPERRSRLIFFFTLIVAVAISIYWFVYTIQSKWIYSRNHPLQTVSLELAPSLPALFGHGFVTYNTDIMHSNLNILTSW